jgi:hypothetical protein
MVTDMVTDMAMATKVKRNRSHALAKRGPGLPRLKLVSFATLTAILAVASARNAVLSVVRVKNPDFALRVKADDPVAVGKAVDDRMIAGELSSSDVPLLRQSLRLMPISATSLRLLSIADPGANRIGNPDLFQLAERMTRRDLGINLMAVEFAVQSNDVERAFRAYDASLRVSPPISELLFPRLAAAATDKELLVGLTKVIRSDPPWLVTLVDWATQTAPDLGAWIPFMQSIPLDSSAWVDGRKQALVARLAILNDNPAAYRMYRRFSGRKDGEKSLQQFFGSGSFAPFDWVLDPQDVFAVSQLGNGSPFAFGYSVDLGRGVLATRMLALKAGQYVLSAAGTFQSDSKSNAPQWTMTCAGSSKMLLNTAMTGNGSGVKAVATFNVPDSNCAFQSLEFIIAGTSGSGTVTGLRIRRATLTLRTTLGQYGK